MTLLDGLNNFRNAILTKTVIDRKMKITTSHNGTAELYGPAWPEISFFLNHINHANHRNGQGPHLFHVTFSMVHNMTGIAEIMGESMTVASITLMIPAAPSPSAPPIATVAMGSGKQISFAFGSLHIVSRKR
jgi:hypothetical protein